MSPLTEVETEAKVCLQIKDLDKENPPLSWEIETRPRLVFR
jgi:hypothetical protein